MNIKITDLEINTGAEGDWSALGDAFMKAIIPLAEMTCSKINVEASEANKAWIDAKTKEFKASADMLSKFAAGCIAYGRSTPDLERARAPKGAS